MSADDATARWLDEQIDLALARGGELPTDLVGSELGEVIQLFATDVAALDEQPMPDASGVRRRLLEQVGDEAQAGATGASVLVRGAWWSVGRAWRARRVVMVAGCMLVVCTTLALADTRTPAGRAVRTAARTLQIPVPAEPRRPDARPANDRASTGPDERPDGQVAPADPKIEHPPADAPQPRPAPDDAPPPSPDGERPFDEHEPRVDGGDEFMPSPGEGEPMPPPDGQEPQPSYPKPPAGEQPPPDDYMPPPDGTKPPPPEGTAPAPAPAPGTQPPPPPGGTQPMLEPTR